MLRHQCRHSAILLLTIFPGGWEKKFDESQHSNLFNQYGLRKQLAGILREI